MTTLSTAPAPHAPAQAGWALSLRRAAAAGCAGAVTGLLVAFPGGRLVMRALAAANPEDAGSLTDDGFVVGQVTASGTGQLLLAALQLSMLGAGLYLLVRLVLLGPTWFRTATVSLGVGVTLGAMLTNPDGFDFVALDPPWLPILLFTLLPLVHVVVFATLAERWMADGSWFSRAPSRSVALTLLVWLAAGVTLVLVVPVFLLSIGALLLLSRRPTPTPVRATVVWLARLGLVTLFVLSLIDLLYDTQQLVG